MQFERILIFSLYLLASVSALRDLTFNTIDVEMGNIGNDDDIRLKVCEGPLCCTTQILSNLFGSEWVANTNETWTGGKLGNCTEIPFDERTKKIAVTIFKDGNRDPLNISALTVRGNSGENVISFLCGEFNLKATDRIQSKACVEEETLRQFVEDRSLPSLVLSEIEVEVGAVGSDEDMRVRVCDDQKCCTSRVLSHLLGSEWEPNTSETWSGRKLGNCSEILFRQNSLELRVSLVRTGPGPGPIVSRLVVRGHVGTNQAQTRSFHCGSFELGNQSQQSKSCVPELLLLQQTPDSEERFRLDRVIVQVGEDGTDDDVSLTVGYAHGSFHL